METVFHQFWGTQGRWVDSRFGWFLWLHLGQPNGVAAEDHICDDDPRWKVRGQAGRSVPMFKRGIPFEQCSTTNVGEWLVWGVRLPS